MLNNKLHIVAFDVPYPPDYGGVIDVFYKIQKLAEQGIQIYLHCFQYGRPYANVLEQYCTKVWYYPRKTGIKGLSFKQPYMQYSRRDPTLLPNLLSVEAPILFEGLHCCHLLSAPELITRDKWVRNQNIEQEYFALLAQREPNWLKKAYYRIEAALLKKAEEKLDAAKGFICVSDTDQAFFQHLYPQHAVHYVPSFQAYDQVNGRIGQGTYCLYHGNLGHPENIEAALFLAEKVFPNLSIPLVIAGRNPSDKIVQAIKKHAHIQLIKNPDDGEMQQLISNAHIQVLPTFQASGLKLKLLNALFAGRHVLVNQSMLQGTGLDEACIVCSNDNAACFIEQIEKWMTLVFDEETKNKRAALLKAKYDNERNAAFIIDLLQA